jgi:hypothetical protein
MCIRVCEIAFRHCINVCAMSRAAHSPLTLTNVIMVIIADANIYDFLLRPANAMLTTGQAEDSGWTAWPDLLCRGVRPFCSSSTQPYTVPHSPIEHKPANAAPHSTILHNTMLMACPNAIGAPWMRICLLRVPIAGILACKPPESITFHHLKFTCLQRDVYLSLHRLCAASLARLIILLSYILLATTILNTFCTL